MTVGTVVIGIPVATRIVHWFALAATGGLPRARGGLPVRLHTTLFGRAVTLGPELYMVVGLSPVHLCKTQVVILTQAYYRSDKVCDNCNLQHCLFIL